ncbi:hypothetical protein D3C87_1730310 [compost metagenome]
MFDIGQHDLEDIIEISGQPVHLDDLGNGPDGRMELLQPVRRMAAGAHDDENRRGQAHLAPVQLRRHPADIALLLEAGDASRTGRRRQGHAFRKLSQGRFRIGLQKAQNLSIAVIQHRRTPCPRK